MSEANQIIEHIVGERTSWTGDVGTVVRTGRQFTAELEAISDQELNSELGRDPRENVTLYTLDRAAVAELRLNDRVTFNVYGRVLTLQILRRSDNPLNPQASFGCMKVTERDL